MAKKVAVIVGAGSKHDRDGEGSEDLPPTTRYGLGGALSLRFATEGGYHVVLMGRREAILKEVASEVAKAGGEASIVTCDVTSADSVAAAFRFAKSVGSIEVLVFNAGAPMPPGVTFSNLQDPGAVDPEYLMQSFDISVAGALRCVQQVLDDMITNKTGTILLSGATAALRGGAKFAMFAPAKFALRGLGQSLSQAYAPKGIHVAHVIIDGVIDSPNTRAWGTQGGGSLQLMDPKDLADAFLGLVRQPPTCWSHELQVSPQLGTIGGRL